MHPIRRRSRHHRPHHRLGESAVERKIFSETRAAVANRPLVYSIIAAERADMVEGLTFRVVDPIAGDEIGASRVSRPGLEPSLVEGPSSSTHRDEVIFLENLSVLLPRHAARRIFRDDQ